MCACLENSLAGLKTRFSCEKDVMFFVADALILSIKIEIMSAHFKKEEERVNVRFPKQTRSGQINSKAGEAEAIFGLRRHDSALATLWKV